MHVLMSPQVLKAYQASGAMVGPGGQREQAGSPCSLCLYLYARSCPALGRLEAVGGREHQAPQPPFPARRAVTKSGQGRQRAQRLGGLGSDWPE